MAEKYPLDFLTLAKGDVIQAEQIEAIYGRPRSDPRFSFDMLALSREIERQRSDLVTRQDHGTIRIMTDLEASEYLDQQTDRHTHGLRRNAARAARIDVSGFSMSQRLLHDARERKAAMVALAAEGARRAGLKELLGARTAALSHSASADERRPFSEVRKELGIT